MLLDVNIFISKFSSYIQWGGLDFLAKDRIVCIIPARYNSTRLPGKPLIEIDGLPLIMWAYNNAYKSNVFDDVIVATDDYRIKECVEKHNGKAILTFQQHLSGTDRVNEVIQDIDCSFIVNLQGDEPIISSDLLNKIAQKTKNIDNNSIVTAAVEATALETYDPSCVKVVLNKHKNAIFFSRSPISLSQDTQHSKRYKHLGIYGFTKESLNYFCSKPLGELEKIEKIELLRALENNMNINCIITEEASIGIDTENDLKLFKDLLKKSFEGETCH